MSPYHHGNLRAALLDEAERRLDDGELSLRELARAVGVSHGAPRRHFADKQALLDALAEEGFDRLGHTLSYAAADGDLTARLAALARAYVRFATEHGALLDLMFAGKHRSEAAADRAFAAPLALIAEAQAAGEVVAGDPERVAKAAFAAVHGLAALANAGVLEADDGLVTETVERLVLGLRPRSPGSSGAPGSR